MTDLANATVQAVFDKLTASILPEDAAVYQHPPEMADMARRYVIIAGLSVEDIGGKGEEFERHMVTIECYDPSPAVKPLHALMAKVKDALKDQPLTSATADLSPPSFLSADDVMIEDEAAEVGTIYVGVARFSLFAQPLG